MFVHTILQIRVLLTQAILQTYNSANTLFSRKIRSDKSANMSFHTTLPMGGSHNSACMFVRTVLQNELVLYNAANVFVHTNMIVRTSLQTCLFTCF